MSVSTLRFWYERRAYTWHSAIEHLGMKKAFIEGDLGRRLDEVEGCRIDHHDAQRMVWSRSEPGVEDWIFYVSVTESIGIWRDLAFCLC